jgi:peptide/nickel transport system substrate-binding protein
MTIEVKMEQPWTTFPFALAGSRNGIIGRAQIDAGPEGCKEKLVGTGPFQLVSWTRNQQLETKKNPNYWRKDANGVQLPYLDSLTFKPIEGGENRLAALEGGTVDAIQTSGATQINEIKKSPDKYNLIPEAEGRHEVTYGQMNISKAPFNDPAIRLALLQAVDRDALNDIMTDGESTIANQPFDSKVLGYVDGLELPKYDPDAAAKVLKGKNLTFRLSYTTDPTTKLAMEDIKRQLGDVGVAVTIEEKDQSTLINSMLSGDFDALFTRNHPGTDPDNQYIWWHSGSPVNFGRINDPQMDQLLEQGRAESDTAKRKTIYQDVAKLFADKVYDIWAYYAKWAFGTSKKVHNLGYNTLPDGSKGTGLNWGWTYLPEVWVDN